jgi:glycosyl transferase family 25
MKDVSCFVINLEKDTERREQISRQLESLGIPYTIFGAVYGKALTPEEMQAHYDKARAISTSHDMTPSEIGCALSHIFIYKKMVAEGIPYALILEDDAKLSEDLPGILSGLTAQFKSSDPVATMLTHVKKYKQRNASPLGERHQVVSIYGTPVCAHGYFITQAAAKKFLDNLYPVWTVADDWAVFDKAFATIKAVVPYCIGLSDFAKLSNLQEERDSIKLKRSLGFHLHHIFYHKFINQIFVRPFQRVATQKETW